MNSVLTQVQCPKYPKSFKLVQVPIPHLAAAVCLSLSICLSFAIYYGNSFRTFFVLLIDALKDKSGFTICCCGCGSSMMKHLSSSCPTIFSFSTSTLPCIHRFLLPSLSLVLLFLLLRSWKVLVRMTQTSSPLFTLVFAKPSRPMGQCTPHCSPERSRTKLSMCTGSRKNTKRAAEGPDRPSNTGETP